MNTATFFVGFCFFVIGFAIGWNIWKEEKKGDRPVYAAKIGGIFAVVAMVFEALFPY